MAAVLEKEVISERRQMADLRLTATDPQTALQVRSKSSRRPTGRVGLTLDQKVEGSNPSSPATRHPQATTSPGWMVRALWAGCIASFAMDSP